MDREISITTPLSGHHSVIGDVTLNEVNPEIFCIFIPKKMDEKVAGEFKRILKFDVPIVGQSNLNKNSTIRLVRNSLDQFFILFEKDSEVAGVIKSLEKDFYITEQSDAWVGIEISGKSSHACLQRICPLDLSTESFGINTAVRTLMEHLNVLIIKTAEDSFLLLSASSSANSFLSAVETSAQNIA
ncbi:MAG: hypothetical protein VYA61_02395 [Pseudomonadota bacterium]|nr:hypothetical protein [Pseudomonadota bacterium]